MGTICVGGMHTPPSASIDLFYFYFISEYQKVRVCVPVSQQDKQAIPALRRGRAGPIPLPAKSHQLK